MVGKCEKWWILPSQQKISAFLLGRASFLLVLAFLLAFAACGQAGATRHTVTGACDDQANSEHGGPPFVISCDVTFLPTVSYTQALRAITDIGLALSLVCSRTGSNGNLIPRWVPAGQQAIF